MQRPGDVEGRAAPWLSETALQVSADENEQAAAQSAASLQTGSVSTSDFQPLKPSSTGSWRLQIS